LVLSKKILKYHIEYILFDKPNLSVY